MSPPILITLKFTLFSLKFCISVRLLCTYISLRVGTDAETEGTLRMNKKKGFHVIPSCPASFQAHLRPDSAELLALQSITICRAN